MTESQKAKLIPAMTVMLGATVTMLVTAVVDTTDASVSAAISEFQQLDSLQQEEVRSRAAGFRDRTESDIARLKEMHAAVTQDKSLMVKLVQLRDWYRSLDQESRNKLMPDGDFTNEWQQQVEQIYFDQMTRVPEIVVSLSTPDDWKHPQSDSLSFAFDEHQFIDFVDGLMPAELPSELQWKLHELPGSNEATLAKTIWLSQEMLGGTGQRFDWVKVMQTVDDVHGAILNNVADSADRVALEKWESVLSRNWRIDPVRCHVMLSWRVVREGMSHFEKQLLKEHKQPNEQERLKAFSQLSPAEQLILMGKDPAAAEKQLNRIALESTERPAISQLLSEYTQISDELERRLQFLFGRIGPGGPRRPRPDGGQGRQGFDRNGAGPPRPKTQGPRQ